MLQHLGIDCRHCHEHVHLKYKIIC
jgi:hypothetical protein